jgi:putative ATP-dependent endonuclease of OLD family
VDDVEAALHPAAQATFARTVATRVRESGGQVIFATHSPSVLEAVPTDDIYEIRRTLAHSVVRPPDASRTRVLGALRLLGYRPSMLQMAEVVMFVEGPSDEAAVRSWWRTLFSEVPEPSVALVSLGGSNYMHLARETLQALGRPVVVLLDSDRAQPGAQLKPRLAAFAAEMQDVARIHVLERRELENYFTPEAVASAMDMSNTPVIDPFRRFSDAVPNYGKMAHAGRIAAEMSVDVIPEEIASLLTQVRDLAAPG